MALNNLKKHRMNFLILWDVILRTKINIAADAPVGLIISEGLRAQIASVHQALQDTEFSLSLVQTAEGALVEVNNLLLEMRQLALTAANESE